MARSYGTYEAFATAMKEAAPLSGDAWSDLNAIEGIGEVVARAMVEFYKEPRNIEVIGRLLEEVTPVDAEQPVTTGSPVAGKTVVFTGSLEKFTRDEAKARAESLAPRWRDRSRRRPTSLSPVPAPARSSTRPVSSASRRWTRTSGWR